MNVHSIAPLIEKYYPEYYSWNQYPSEQCIPFCKADGQWGLLSNFARTPIMVHGVQFSCVEQLFQMMKFRDEVILKEIHQKAGMPMKWVAQRGEKDGLRRDDWGMMIVDAMIFCLKLKYGQSEEFRNMLEATQGSYIVEDQTNKKTLKSGRVKDADTWGMVLKDGNYVGSNLMGILLMELRDNHGCISYELPSDALGFIEMLKSQQTI